MRKFAVNSGLVIFMITTVMFYKSLGCVGSHHYTIAMAGPDFNRMVAVQMLNFLLVAMLISKLQNCSGFSFSSYGVFGRLVSTKFKILSLS